MGTEVRCMRYSGGYETREDPADRWEDPFALPLPPRREKASGVLLKSVVFLLLLATLSLLYIRQYTVTGDSMEPTLMAGDRVFYVGFSRANYADIVIFDAGEPYGLVIKRVAGLPGDRVSVTADGHLLRNGEAIDEAYLLPDALGNSAMEEITIDSGKLFVLGDHRAASIDSRDIRVGQIDFASVRGVVTQLLRNTAQTP